jgi:hypothetical protein
MASVPSAAAQVIVTVIPIVGIVMGSIVIFFYLLWNHKQKVLLIEKGLYKRSGFDLLSFSLLSGILLTAIGSVLTVFFLLLEGLSYSLLGGVIPLTIGICLLIFFGIKKRIERNE